MTRNYADLEREIIEDLAPRTGRSLAQWMDAIKAAGLSEKNAIIDWLRPQGFTFANASWLERIHNNGGRPIYLDQPASTRAARQRPTPQPAPGPQAAPVSPGGAAPAAASAPAPAPGPVVDPDRLKELLGRGKAFRPLAEMLLREISRALPETALVPSGDLIILARPRELAALQVEPRGLKLVMDLGDRPLDAPLAKARVPGANPRLAHMVVLTDARQVTPALLDLLRLADTRSNPPPPGAI